MLPPPRSLFRERALAQYQQRQQRAMLPQLVSPPVFLCSWILLSLLVLAAGLAWWARVPIFVSGSGVLQAQYAELRLSPWSPVGRSCRINRAHLQRLVVVLEAAQEQQVQPVHAPPRLTGRIWLDQVSFQYDPQGQKVLQDITVQIEAGQKVALVGRTGSGKSTLGKLLLGLCQPTEGEICYDDIPLPVMNYQQVRAQCGVVLQDVHVFNGSIRQNITFYNPELRIWRRLLEAAEVEQGYTTKSFQMPMGYETVVSEQEDPPSPAGDASAGAGSCPGACACYSLARSGHQFSRCHHRAESMDAISTHWGVLKS